MRHGHARAGHEKSQLAEIPPVQSASALLARIDRIAAELAELRAEIAGAEVAVRNLTAEGAEPAEDDGSAVRNWTSADDLIDTHSASARFGHPADSIRKWCRTEGLGIRSGGRWLVSIPRLQKRINGGG